MGGVDLHDSHCNYLLPSFRSKKWTWVIFERLIQSAVTNVNVLSNSVRDERKSQV